MRILGIDPGSTSIKAVELESAFGRYEIHEYHEIKIEPGVTLEETLRRFVTTLPKPPHKIAVAQKTSQTTFRNLTLPTRDKKAIQASVGFELEDELPFSLEQSVYDYSILSQTGPSTRLHVGTTLKKHLAHDIERWQEAGIDPDLITTESWAYRGLLNRILSPADQEKPVLVVQMGHERTILYAHWQGAPVIAREIAWGGRDLTTAICKKYGIPVEQAETTKLSNGFVLPPSQRGQATPEQMEFSATLLGGLEELEKEIRQAELVIKNSTHESLSRIYLAGGTSLLPGLRRTLEETYSIPVVALQGLSAVTASGVTYSEHSDAVFTGAAAIALCLVGPERSMAINLRKDEFAKRGQRGRELNLAGIKGPLIAAGIVMTCFFASIIVQNSVYTSKIKEADQQLEKSVKSFFGQLSNTAVKNYLSNTTLLKNSIQKELNKQKEFAKLLGPNPKSPLNFLKDVSASIPSDTVVDLTQFQVGAAPSAPFTVSPDNSATLTFLVTNPQMAEKLATIMGNKISGMQRSKMDEVTAPDGTSKRWKVTFSGKPSEESYGK